MNSCILMAQVVSDPELRSTQDNTNVSSMMVEFESTREGEPPEKLQVEGWGRLAEEIKNTYTSGDRIIIEGRLAMNLFEMPEGYKEKRAKLVASRVYPISASASSNSNSSTSVDRQNYEAPAEVPNNVVDFASTMHQAPPTDSNTTVETPNTDSDSGNNEDWDEIPF